ncbi:MAG: GNAT family N-acetyltransferase [Bacteroidales bacterium]|nr:GNAT family N-acetyltransferase [Bacteroidales bacterium]
MMGLKIKTLNKIHFDQIHSAFVEAFSDYQVDISYMTPDVMKKRFLKNGYRPELSAGIFDQDELKGFTIVGTGKFKGSQSGFDIMTGIIKDHRGKGLANQMFDLIKDKMKEQAINTFYLEVLQEHHAAIKAYEKTGFKKTRNFNCYLLNVGKLKPAKPIQTVVYIDRITKSEINEFLAFLDWEPSWENHYESIKRIPGKVDIFVARSMGKNIGVLVYYPTLKWILTLAVDAGYRQKGVATALLEYFLDYLPIYIREIKILNIDEGDIAMNRFLIDSGFELITSQYEMEYKI